MSNLRRNLLASLTVGMALGTLIFVGSTPATSVGSVTFNGTTLEQVGLAGEDNGLFIVQQAPRKSALATPSVTVNYMDNADDPAPFSGTISMGSLSGGDGTNDVYEMRMKVRGNSQCFVTSTVSGFTANNIRYQSAPNVFTDLSGDVNLNDMTMITLSNDGTTNSGALSNPSNCAYQARWNTNATLATLNAGEIGAISNTKERVCNFSDAPSREGNWNTPDNAVRINPRITVPTGFRWSPVTQGVASDIQLIFQFEAYLGA